MIVQRIVSGVVAIAAATAAAGVVVVAAAFAVFTLLQAYVGPSGAAAIIAAVLALVLAAAAVFMLGRAEGSGKPAAVVPLAEQSLPQRLFYTLQARPVLAAGAAVATGLIAWRNPRLAGLVSGLFALSRQRT